MAWVKERITDDGDTRFVACYRDPEGDNAPPAPMPPAVPLSVPATVRSPGSPPEPARSGEGALAWTLQAHQQLEWTPNSEAPAFPFQPARCRATPAQNDAALAKGPQDPWSLESGREPRCVGWAGASRHDPPQTPQALGNVARVGLTGNTEQRQTSIKSFPLEGSGPCRTSLDRAGGFP